jgi:hypothetical protein
MDNNQSFILGLRVTHIEKILVDRGVLTKTQLDESYQKYLAEDIGMPGADGKMPGQPKITFYGI